MPYDVQRLLFAQRCQMVHQPLASNLPSLIIPININTRRTHEYDGRGSGAFAHVPSNVIGIDKCVNPNGSLRCTQLSLLLCREHGRQQGKADKLVMPFTKNVYKAFHLSYPALRHS
jgi:hypothetical protein